MRLTFGETTSSTDAAYKFAAIINSSSDAIISTNLDGIITSWNKAAEKIFGFDEIEAVGKHISIILPSNKIEEEKQIILLASTGNNIEHYETVRLAKNGNLVPVSLSVSPIVNDKGTVIGIAKIARDITEQRISQEKNAMLAAIVDSSEDAIISKNLNGIITSWNKGAERIFGYTEAEAIGKHITLIIPDYRRSEEDVIIGKIKKGERVEHFETKRITKYGEEKDLSITVSPVKNNKNEIIGASKIARDITESVKAKAQLEQYAKQLQTINTYKDEFISLASHELNTPLTSLKVYLQILEKNITKDEHPENYHFITKAINLSEKMAKLIKDLLDVSKIETGKLQLNMHKFDLKALLDDTIESMSTVAKNHLFVYRGIEENLEITGDQDRIEQVLVNVISNAIKYSPRGGQIIITTYLENEQVHICIKDYGIGIPANQLDKIFTRFFRVEGLEASFAGLGIGLYLSKQIVTRHKGLMKVESIEGEGSMFTIILPVDQTEKN